MSNSTSAVPLRPGVPPSTDAIRAASGSADESARLHQLRREQPEAYNLESQAHAQMLKKSLVYGFTNGCSFAAMIFGLNRTMPNLNWRAMGIAASLPVGAAAGYTVFSLFCIEKKFYDREREREDWELHNYPEGEYDEMTAIYMGKGLTEQEARRFIMLLARDHDQFVDIMMVEELGYSCRPMPSQLEALKAATIATLGFTVGAAVPLLPSDSRIGHAVLGGTVLAASMMQAKILFGAYADVYDFLATLRNNAAWLTSLTALSTVTALGVRRAMETAKAM